MLAESPRLTKQLTGVLVAGSCLAIGALTVRVHRTGSMWFAFMVWNLVLAVVPFAFALLLQARWQRQPRVSAGLVLLTLGWLVFFPNAPYVLTDVVHLGNDQLWWYDLPLVMAFAGTSWLAGLMSLDLVDGVLTKAVSRNFARGVVLATCWLSGMGVYLGRFLRFNSWDIIESPRTLTLTALDKFIPPWRHPQPHTFALFFAVLLLGSYMTFRMLHAKPELA